jgi:hypothetical protein
MCIGTYQRIFFCKTAGWSESRKYFSNKKKEPEVLLENGQWNLEAAGAILSERQRKRRLGNVYRRTVSNCKDHLKINREFNFFSQKSSVGCPLRGPVIQTNSGQI